MLRQTVDLDHAASVRALRSGSPMFNQMVWVYTVQPRSHLGGLLGQTTLIYVGCPRAGIVDPGRVQ